MSTYSQDFQTILSRAVSIASLPLKQLQSEDSSVLSRKSLYGPLQSAASGLASALSALGETAAHRAMSATSSDSAAVSAKATGAAGAGVYRISEVTSLATAASEVSRAGYADPKTTAVSSTGSMRLAVGSKTFDLALASNSLEGLADAINGLNADVTASVFTADGLSYLNLTRSTTGECKLSLTDDSGGANSSWLTAQNQGTDAHFLLNGVPVTRSSNLVRDAIAGVDLELQAKTAPGQSIEVKVSSDRAQLASALQSVATRYNAAVDEISKHIGKTADLLTGDTIVRDIQGVMREFASMRSGDSAASLATMGVSFGTDGKMSVDNAAAGSLSPAALSGALDLLASKAAGAGAIASKLSVYSDPVSGIIQNAVNALARTDERLQAQMAEATERVNVMQAALQEKLQKADTLLAQLQGQQTMIEASLKGLNLTLYGRQNDS